MGCTPHRHRRGRRKRGHSGGLHATSLLKREKKVTTQRWVAHHIVIEEEEESNDTACGLHAASSSKREKKAMTRRVDCTPYCLSSKREKKAMTRRVGCTLYRHQRGRRKRQHGVWIARHIIVEEGKESDNTVCGLHATSSLKREKKATTWCVDCTPRRRRRGKRKQ